MFLKGCPISTGMRHEECERACVRFLSVALCRWRSLKVLNHFLNSPPRTYTLASLPCPGKRVIKASWRRPSARPETPLPDVNTGLAHLGPRCPLRPPTTVLCVSAETEATVSGSRCLRPRPASEALHPSLAPSGPRGGRSVLIVC